MAAEALYHQIGRNLSKDDINRIEDFYGTWKGQSDISLKFRFVKLFGVRKDTNETSWYLLHQLTNKRRITNQQLPNLINEVIENGIVPLRIFHSTTEWLAPNEVFTNPHHHPQLINAGFIPFENDESLETSLATSCELHSILQGQKLFVFSGNKSIHTWYFIENLDLKTGSALAIEKAERQRRYAIFKKVQGQIHHEIDNRISGDTRRVVPIINSLNAFTGRKVIKISDDKICSYSTSEIFELSSIK